MTDGRQHRAQLEAAIAGLESQRTLLGDLVVEPALAALRKQLAELGPSSATTASEEMDADRRIVTVVFADLSGFTAMSEGMDPEPVRSLMNDCFRHLVPIVEKYGGTVDKFIGDEIMVLFGAPAAHENDPERALRTALEMKEAIATFNAAQGLDLGMHFGVNTGPVIAGGMGSSRRRQYSVLGDAVNLASRLADAALRNDILVGPDTYRHAAPFFEFDAASPLSVKGKAAPVMARRLLGLKAAPDAVRGIAGIRSLLVGRDAQLLALNAALAALRAGHGGIVAVSGDAGVGKSRLVAEGRQALPPDVRWAEGRALSHTPGMSYWLARDVLYDVLGVKADASMASIGVALQQGVAHACPDRELSVYPYLARLLDVPTVGAAEEALRHLAGAVLQSRMLSAFQEYLRGCASRQVLVVAWEDLHWSDPSSLQVLASLLPLTAEVPLLLLLTYRPDEGAMSPLLEQLRQQHADRHVVVSLDPLTRDDSRVLVEHLLGAEQVPPETRRLILDRAEGNPFFLEEVIRGLIDSGGANGPLAAQTAGARAAEWTVPSTLQGILMARLDRLEAGTKSTLQEASVLGRVFQKHVLLRVHEAADRSEVGLEPVLNELQRREFIRPRDHDAGAGRGLDAEFIFKHALTHDVAYNSLLLARRKAIHLTVGEAMESIFPDRLDELAASLARHFANAERRDKAIHYLNRAGERAQATFANAEAIGFYRDALDQIELAQAEGGAALPEAQPGSASRLHERVGDLLELTGRHDEARTAYEEALARTPASDSVAAARRHRKWGSSHLIQRRYEETLRGYLEAERRLGADANVDAVAWWTERVDIYLERMWLDYWRGRVQDMIDLGGQCRPALEQHGSPSQRGRFFVMLALSNLRRGRYVACNETLAYAEAAAATLRESDNLAAAPHVAFVLGFTRLWHGDLDTANDQLLIAELSAERVGDVVNRTRALIYLMVVARKRGRIDDVRHYLTRARQAALDLKMVEYIAMAKAHAGWLAWRDGALDEAHACCAEALATWHQMPVPYMFDWMALWPLIGVCARREQVAEAIAHARTLFRPEQQPLPADLAAATQKAIDAWDQQQPEVAGDHLARAVALAREGGWL